MWRPIIKYGLILFVALSGLKLLEFQFFSYKMSLEIYLGTIAILFLLIGFVAAWFLTKNKISPESQVTKENKSPDVNRSEKSIIEIPEAANSFVPDLSERELQILVLLAHGYTNKEIACSLSISPNTVKTHLSSVFAKLQVSNRTQAVSEAKLLKIIN